MSADDREERLNDLARMATIKCYKINARVMDSFLSIIILPWAVRPIGMFLIFLSLAIFVMYYSYPVLASVPDMMPTINDPNLKLELVSQQEIQSSSMAFLGIDDILLLHKDNGYCTQDRKWRSPRRTVTRC